MNYGKYSFKKLLTDHSLDQILIPEIQRDYVWKKENVIGLLNSIQTDLNKNIELEKSIDKELLSSLPPDIAETVKRSVAEKKVYTNIGFIYAYNGEGEISSKYFLIDGQQRVTTLYLLLLAASLKDAKGHVFRNTYFNNKQPKVDYKVRELAHDFFVEFIDFILNGGNVVDVTNQYWYYKKCESDKTIQSLIENYKIIEKFLKTSELNFGFVEDQIELFYFDTAKSEQGEELYIYMNSRGESVMPNENIKAQLLENKSESEKHKSGEFWENWQNFFWLNKGDNENADLGFDEFLRWVKIIEYLFDNPQSNQKDQIEFVRKTRSESKLSTEYISFEKIEKYINALKFVTENSSIFIGKSWLNGVKDFIDYVIILPTLVYVAMNKSVSQIELSRFIRFFVNIIKNEDVYKNPAIYAPQAVLLTKKFCEAGYIDVADLINVKTESEYDNLLTKEEIFKFSLFKNPVIDYSREVIENEFIVVEDFEILNGSISFILKCMDTPPEIENVVNFDMKQFIRYSLHFRNIFENPNDLMRRAMLTIGDYAIWNGYSTSLEMERYNFGSDSKTWKAIIDYPDLASTVVSFIKLFKRKRKMTIDEYNQFFQEMIDECIQSNIIQDWRKIFINKPKNLAFCEDKRACIGDKEVYLLQRIKVMNESSYKRVKI